MSESMRFISFSRQGAPPRPRPARSRLTRAGIVPLLFVALLLFSAASASATMTSVTKYQYNADGALTAITKQAADGSTTTTYLVWDDFVPSASDPTTGTVSAANGRLLGYGPSPDNLTTTFQFDVRDRLKGFSSSGQS